MTILDPAVQSFVDRATEGGLLPYGIEDPARRQEIVRHLQRQAEPGPARRIAITGGHSEPVPLHISRSDRAHHDLPVLLYLHGGFWSCGGWETHGAAAATLAEACGATLVFVDYDLTSPEIALKQARTALVWTFEQGAGQGFDIGRVAIAGDGTGATMAAILSATAPTGAQLRFQLLFHPVAAAEGSEQGSPWLDAAGLARLMPETGLSPLDLPLENLRRSPPTLIVTADADPAGAGGEMLARRLMLAEVECSAARLIGTIHDFFWLDALADTAPTQAGNAFARQALRTAFAP